MIKNLLFILISFCAFSQNNKGEIIYSVKIQTDTTITNNSIKRMMENAANGASYLNFSLKFQGSAAKFSLIDIMEVGNNRNISMALSWCNYNNPIYANAKTKQTLFYSSNKRGMFKKNEYLVKKNYNDWKILNESKVINDFLCFKAQTVISNTNLSGKKISRTITAWFCPKIPLDYGPNGYAGLPGLILELNDKNITFGVTKISYKDVVVNLPTKGKKIDYKEYQNLLKEKILNQKGKIEKRQ